MKTIRFIAAVTILFSVASFTSAPAKNDPKIGTWIYADYDADAEAMIYTKVQSFKEDKPGIQFLPEGKFIKRQNVGWCGTPPIQYGNSDGTWEQTSDSTITISYSYWGGTAEEDWKIVRVTDKKLVVEMLDHRSPGIQIPN